LATTKEVATAAPEAMKIRDNREVFTPGREDDDTRVRTGYRTPKLALGNASRLQASLSIVPRQAEATAHSRRQVGIRRAHYMMAVNTYLSQQH